MSKMLKSKIKTSYLLGILLSREYFLGKTKKWGVKPIYIWSERRTHRIEGVCSLQCIFFIIAKRACHLTNLTNMPT